MKKFLEKIYKLPKLIGNFKNLNSPLPIKEIE